VKRFKAPVHVCGVTYWINKIYLVCVKSTEIHVYDAKTFDKETSLTEDLSDPSDIAAHNDCLYILDPAYILLRYFEPNYKVQKLSVIANKRYRKLSIASNGRLIMVNDFPPSIDIFDPPLSSSKLKTINLEGLDLPRYPRHVIEIESDTFIVSYGKLSNDNGLSEITRINEKISITKKFPVVTTLHLDGREDDDSMLSPGHLTKDGAGNIFVADSGKYRVTILDRNFKVIDVISYNKFEPSRLWFHSEEANGTDGLLIIGRCTGWVDVYKVTQSNRSEVEEAEDDEETAFTENARLNCSSV